jgi:hypothetical protein
LIEGALAGEANQYEFAASAGQTTTIMLIPLDDWDPTLTILNSDGTVAVNRVDNGFPGDSEVITFIPEEDGNYIVLVDGFSNAEGSYNLFLLDPEVAYSTEGSVETDEVQDIRVCVPANASLAIVVLPAEGFDVVINVKDGNGAKVIEEVDGTPSGDPEAVFVNESINPDAAYPLIVSISGWAGQEGEFSVFITSTSEEEVAIDGC